MATRIVEWKKPYTWGKAITVDENKVISLNLRWENNLIIRDEWDNEIYVDLQLPDWRTPQDTFPVWITTGRVSSGSWDVTWTIIIAKTSNFRTIKILYGDDWTLWMDNDTWTFKQIYFKGDVDTIVSVLQNQIDALSWLGKFLSSWDCQTWEPISFPLEVPYPYTTWDWYLVWIVDTTTNYRPAWDEWDNDDPSTKELETETVEAWDVYIYDWSVRLLQKNTLPAGSWNVIWPDNAIDWHLAVFDGTSGKIIKDWWPIPTWAGIEYKTQAEYSQITPDPDKHYFIYRDTSIHVTWVTLNESSISLGYWDTYQLTATVTPNDATDPSVTWSSSDDTVATVSSTWLVTYAGDWNATITVTTTDGGFTDTCWVTAIWWQPWANTLAYYPFDTDILDHSSNSRALTWDTWTKWTIWYTFTSNVKIANADLPSNAKFLNFWCKINSVSQVVTWTSWVVVVWWFQQLCMSYYTFGRDAYWAPSTLDNVIAAFVGNNWSFKSQSWPNDISSWHNICLWYDWTDTMCAIDWVRYSLNAWLNPSAVTNELYLLLVDSWMACSVELADFIVESQWWTAWEISNYYDNTKSKFWIS